ncbi:flagellar hook-basal body protein [Paenibacillus sp. MBLB4367]|uniref:flagellar hook-basal body protein n=1 Tax=Paenibacillus sp. MBLB4367 TaxID=3384767 RepID=UPI003907FD6B
MLRGLYTAAAGMISQQRKHDTITNNIANINTPGFKQGNAVSRSFPEMLLAISTGGSDSPVASAIGRINTGVMAEEDLSIYLQGDLQETKNPFDLALVSNIQVPGIAFDGAGKYITPEGERIYRPQAFFTVQDVNGENRFSRNGRFTVNAGGELVTPEGYRVLGQDGQPVVLVDNADPANPVLLADATIGPQGQFLDAVNGQPLNDVNGNQISLLISRVENPNRLIREGNGVYRLNEEDAAQAVPILNMNDQVRVEQGYIERSNVDPTQSMIDMTAALRAYETNQKMVQFYDKSMEKAVNEVGRV